MEFLNDRLNNEKKTEEDAVKESEDSTLIISNYPSLNIFDPPEYQILKILSYKPLIQNQIDSILNLNCYQSRYMLTNLLKRGLILFDTVEKDKNFTKLYYLKKQHFDGENDQKPQVPSMKALVCSYPTNTNVQTVILKNPRRLERLEYLIELLLKREVLTGHTIIMKDIWEWEKLRGLTVTMDRKSFRRIVEDGISQKLMCREKVSFEAASGRIVTEEWIMLPHLTMKSDICIEKYKQRAMDLKFVDNSVKQEVVCVEQSKKKKKQLTHNLNIEIDLSSITKNLEYDKRLTTDFCVPFLGMMQRRKLLHEFIWYISYAEKEVPGVINNSWKDAHGFRRYDKNPSWRQFVTPLSHICSDSATEDVVFTVNELLMRLPVYLYCLLAHPRDCSVDLYKLLANDHSRWFTLSNIVEYNPSIAAFLYQHNTCINSRIITDLVESLINMGLLSIVDCGFPANHRSQASLSLNRKVFLTDTRDFDILPSSDEISWKRAPRYQFVFDQISDIIEYWTLTYGVCTASFPRSSRGAVKFGIMLTSPAWFSSKHGQQMIRETERSLSLVTHSGPFDIENIAPHFIRQYGCWVPFTEDDEEDNFPNVLKSLGPGGFHYGIVSSSFASWNHIRFDKDIDAIKNGFIRDSFNNFKETLFPDAKRKVQEFQMEVLNEKLSFLLNDINVVYLAAKLLRFEKVVNYYKLISNKPWFMNMFPSLREVNADLFENYVNQLTTNHETIRNQLYKTICNIPLIKTMQKKNTEYVTKIHKSSFQLSPISVKILNLLKEHLDFVPQFESGPTEMSQEQSQINLYQKYRYSQGNSENRHTRKMCPANEVYVRYKQPDCVDNLDNILRITIAKYLLGCISGFKEKNEIDVEFRNKVLSSYTLPKSVAALNLLRNFYCIGSLKAHKGPDSQLRSFDSRLTRFSQKVEKTAARLHPASNTSCVLGTKYRQTSNILQKMMSSKPGQVQRIYIADANEPACAFLITKIISLAIHYQQGHCLNDITFKNIRPGNCILPQNVTNVEKSKHATASNSSIHKIDTQKSSLSHINFGPIIGLSYLEIRGGLPLPPPVSVAKESSWRQLADFDSDLDSESSGEPQKKRLRTDSCSSTQDTERSGEPQKKRLRTDSCSSTQESSLLTIISTGQFAGRNFQELKLKFKDNLQQMNGELRLLLAQKKIFLVGLNDFHFVARSFIEPWLISVDVFNNAHEVSKKRPINKIRKFFPEFYRDEQGRFKYFTFKSVMEQLYIYTYSKFCVELDVLIKDWSLLFGENVLRRLVDILHRYEVLQLHALKEVRDPKPYTLFPEIDYEETEVNIFDRSLTINVEVSIHSELRMDQLMQSTAVFFEIDPSDVNSDTEAMDIDDANQQEGEEEEEDEPGKRYCEAQEEDNEWEIAKNDSVEEDDSENDTDEW